MSDVIYGQPNILTYYDAQRRQSNLKSGRSARGGGGTFLGIYDEPPLLQKPMYMYELVTFVNSMIDSDFRAARNFPAPFTVITCHVSYIAPFNKYL